MLQAYKNRKLTVERNEDVKTSSIIGELIHLPADLFWHLLRSATSDNESLPQTVGELSSVEYWPKWSAEGCDITNRQNVEPDVFIRFQEFDLILEIKKDDNYYGQSVTQWKNEICSYLNEHEDEKKKICLIALGGNDKLYHEVVKNVRKRDVTIYKCRWSSLLEKVNEHLRSLLKLHYIDSHSMQTIRILRDVISAFNIFDDYVMEEFDSFPKNLKLYNNYKLSDLWK